MQYYQSQYKKKSNGDEKTDSSSTLKHNSHRSQPEISDKRKFAKDFMDFIISSGVIGTIIIGLVTDSKKGTLPLFGVKMTYITIFISLCGLRLFILQEPYIKANFRSMIRSILLTLLVSGGFTYWILKTPDQAIEKYMSEDMSATLLTFTSAIFMVFVIFLIFLLLNRQYSKFKLKRFAKKVKN